MRQLAVSGESQGRPQLFSPRLDTCRDAEGGSVLRPRVFSLQATPFSSAHLHRDAAVTQKCVSRTRGAEGWSTDGPRGDLLGFRSLHTSVCGRLEVSAGLRSRCGAGQERHRAGRLPSRRWYGNGGTCGRQ